MFTGIVAETGIVERIDPTPAGRSLTVHARKCFVGAKLGDSFSVNGCCLTVAAMARVGGKRLVRFDLLQETWTRTNFQILRSGSAVNLEASMRMSDRWHGHFVTGHIDATGVIRCWEQSGADRVLEVEPPPGLMPYLAEKGSIAIDGISLTVAKVFKKRFRVWIIPHTYQVTALRERKMGDAVNLETDILAKYVQRMTRAV